MKKVDVLFACTAIFLFISTIYSGFSHLYGNTLGTGSTPSAVRDTISKENIPVTATVKDALQDTKKDTAATPQETQELLTVSPRILFGVWHGKDKLNREVYFSFEETKEGQRGIFNVIVKVGENRVTGNCSDWENNMCDLMLNTKEIQDIRTRWFFKYDGTWLTIQIGDQAIAGSKIFRVKKNESH